MYEQISKKQRSNIYIQIPLNMEVYKASTYLEILFYYYYFTRIYSFFDSNNQGSPLQL